MNKKLADLQRCTVSISRILFRKHSMVLYRSIFFFANYSKLQEEKRQRRTKSKQHLLKLFKEQYHTFFSQGTINRRSARDPKGLLAPY
jgi:hypothetical protein